MPITRCERKVAMVIWHLAFRLIEDANKSFRLNQFNLILVGTRTTMKRSTGIESSQRTTKSTTKQEEEGCMVTQSKGKEFSEREN